jgi:hypothetical protein
MAEDRKFTNSGPGAQTRGESTITNPGHLVPRLGPDTEAAPGERASSVEDTAKDQRAGSQTGTIGGSGPNAHNADPVLTTGVDRPTTTNGEKPTKKRTTKKY